MRNFGEIVVTLMVVVCFSNYVYAQDKNKHSLSFGVEYLLPVENDRNIYTYNIDAIYPLIKFNSTGLYLSSVATLTYATGDIIQLEGEYSEGTLHDVKYKNTAYGLGIGLLAGWEAVIYKNTSFHIEAIESYIYFNEAFPSGGTHGNFMSRIGPSIQYNYAQSSHVRLGYHWAHISNGTGLGSQNPSYDSEGVFVVFSHQF